MIDIQELNDRINEIQKTIGYQFKDIDLLRMACIHSSYLNEHRDDNIQHNERLEFLGDSVLGLIVSHALYMRAASMDEGKLSSLKAFLVEEPSCVRFIELLGIGEFLVMGKGESQNQGKGRTTVLADFFEALIGAIYLDGGLEESVQFFMRHYSEMIDSAIYHPEENPKVTLQDLVQKLYKKPPEYRLVSAEGPGHEKVFCVAVFINGQEVAKGEGLSKKEAQKNAAKNALKQVRDNE